MAVRPWPEFDVLRALAASHGGLTDLNDIDPKLVRYDVEHYISDLLRGHEPYDEVEYAGARQTTAAAVAKTLVGGLVAGLYARHVVAVYEPIRDLARAAEIGGQAPRSLPELLELDLSARAESAWLH